MKLHEAITTVLDNNHNAWMTYLKIAEAIRAQGLYFHGDGQPPEAEQVRARASRYPDLFEVHKGGSAIRIRLAR